MKTISSFSTVKRPDPMCKRIGLVEAVEIVPGGGILYRSTHDDGKQCQWSEYLNLSAMGEAKTDQPPQEIQCPECQQLGIIIAELDESDRMKPDTWNYFVSHPTGSRRCAVRLENRSTILKALDRYIDKTIVEDNNQTQTQTQKRRRQSQHRLEIICPRCDLVGKATLRDNSNRSPDVEHANPDKTGSKISHSMKTPELKEQFYSRLELASKVKAEQERRPTLDATTTITIAPKVTIKQKGKPGRKRARGRPRNKVTSYHKMWMENQRYKKKESETKDYIESIENDLDSLEKKFDNGVTGIRKSISAIKKRLGESQ